ncbi:hypothetical protein RM574_28515 [Streptomyces sp. DSM 41982]|uniref:Uncharacterized protein n=2 Tax=Streptomyces TaxID=1883 RepID=A0ABD5EDZ2_9ACTN|nr:hypothetical protein [Streptomyces sp. DSM 41982]MDT0419427.1 hypothetical protein [Streptomyces sp. DSM 41982]SCE28993.1 hypothetical protein GA0115246_113842 [Streptomyces sp. SolWspMP-sol7th]
MTAGLRVVTAPAALVVFLLALVLVLLLPDGLAYARGRVPRGVPHSTASASPLAPFVELPQPLTGYGAPQSHAPAPAPPPEHPGPSHSGAPHSPALGPSAALDPHTAPAFPGTEFPPPFTALPVPLFPAVPAATATPPGAPHRPGTPSPAAASASPGGSAAAGLARVSPSRTGPPKAPSPRVVPAHPALEPLAPPEPPRGRAPLASPSRASGGAPEEDEALAEEMPLADEVPFTVGTRGTGFLTDGRSRLALGGGLICLGCGLATALLAFRLRRA